MRYFFALSACVYPEYRQTDNGDSLKEEDAYPAQPQHAYGREKLIAEGMCCALRALRQPPQPKISEPLVNSFVSSRINRSGRRQYLRELGRYLPIDCYGSFMRNQTLALDLGRPSKLETIARYKFTLSLESACALGYVTEEFFDRLVAGSVPVYLGAPNVDDFAPGDRCFINLAGFPNPRDLAQYLRGLAVDADAYQSHFAWKQQPYRAGFRKLLALTSAGPITCSATRFKRG